MSKLPVFPSHDWLIRTEALFSPLKVSRPIVEYLDPLTAIMVPPEDPRQQMGVVEGLAPMIRMYALALNVSVLVIL